MNVLEHLEEEHRKVEQLIADLAATHSASEREPILAELGDALAKHMDVEEERIYPIVDEFLGAEVARTAQHEHDTARADLQQLVEQSDRDQFAAVLGQFQEDIRLHVNEEERALFPLLRRRAGGALAALGDAHRLEDEVQQELIEEGLTR
jgi:iron-sulfur cluster repair protein YtfE (RIC family)